MCPPSDEQRYYEIQLKNGPIPVYKIGYGPRLLIALHGFESDGQKFSSWKKTLGEDFTICAPDLPFHGQANWNNSFFDRADILELILAIAEKEGQNRFSVTGFSMGGRLLLCLGPELEQYVDQFILLAPAGIGNYDKLPPLYLQNIGEFLLRWPVWFKWGTDLFHRLGWVSSFQKRYAEVQILPKNRRFRLFRICNSVLDFGTTTPRLIDFWRSNKTPVLLILATRDRIVNNDKIKAYFAKHSNIQLVEIDTKHDLETVRVAEIILEKTV